MVAPDTRDRVSMGVFNRTEDLEGISLSMGNLSSYKLEESIGDRGRLGYGGFGTVYAMRKGRTLCAVKVPTQANIGDPDSSISFVPDEAFVKAYTKEARIWAKVTAGAPDSVVRFIDFGLDPFPWMAMEYADGGSFKKAMDEGKATIYDIIALLRALQPIHDLGINHLDIKPENILKVGNRWKLSDFGMSKMVGNTSVSVGIKGSGIYMAPEQCGGRGNRKDFTTDLWQMAIILYQMVSGRSPYDSDPGDISSLAVEIIMNGPNLDHVPEKYKPVLAKAFNKDHKLRFSSASSFAEALEALEGPAVEEEDQGRKLKLEPGPTFDRGMMLFKGTGSKPDYRSALDMFSLDDSVPSEIMTAIMRYEGLGTSKDTLRAVMMIRELGDLPEPSSPDMQWAYGRLHELGIGMKADKDKAAEYYERSAEGGSCLGQVATYQNRVDEETMIGLLLAAEHGYSPAYKPAYLLYKNRGEDGLRYLVKSASIGDPESQYELGLRYENGDGVAHSPQEALSLYRSASENGIAGATYRLGTFYKNGIAVEQSDETAAEYFAKAMEMGWVVEEEEPAPACEPPEEEDEEEDEDNEDEKSSEPTFDSGEFKYIREFGGLCICGINSRNDRVVIPETLDVNGKPVVVKSISSKAFKGNSRIKSVVIADTVSSIGQAAFKKCSSLESVTLPSRLEVLEKDVFWGCSRLKSIQIPEGLKVIGIGSFGKCKSLSSVTFPSSLKEIGAWAFEVCNSLSSVTIPPSVTTIGYSAFCSCKSLHLVILSKKTEVGRGAFPKGAIMQYVD